MSELLVNTIKKADGTGNLSVPAESGTVVTTASPSLGRRNLIINGAMQVAQRGTSFTGITNSEGWGADRFRFPVGASSGTYTVSQESDGPDGYAKSFKALVTATGSTGGSNYALFRYKFEGQDLQHLKYGTSGAEQITVSFWFKSNKTGTYQVTLRNLNSNRMVGATYNVSSANTWEQKIITFPADTTGSFTNDNGDSLRMDWWLHSGATFNSGSVPTVWATYNSANQAAGQTVNLADTINNYAQITGVQLEVGSIATPFEHRSYGEELALCQRYYWKYGNEGSYTAYGSGVSESDTRARLCVDYPCFMRANPTFSVTNIGNTYIGRGNVTSVPTQLDDSYPGKNKALVDVGYGSAGGAGAGRVWFANSATSSSIQADAEL